MQTQTDIDTDQDLFQQQVELEQLFSKNQLLKRIRQEFVASPLGFEEIMERHSIPIPFGFDLLVQMALHKRVDLPTLVGILRRHFRDSQATATMLLRCTIKNLVDWDSELKQFIVRYTISEDVQQELDRYQFPLPMVIPPRTLRDNMDTGYIFDRRSVILKDNHHDDDVCLDHLNRVNQIRLTLDRDTATMIKNQWRNLDKPKRGESRFEFEKRKRAFKKYDRVSRAVIDELNLLGNEFYLTHRYDKRGRTYCVGYHVNYQGATWNKAVVQLADKELVR